MLSLTEMVKRLRAKPGSTGLLTGNGWYLTKHSMGIYSTQPKTGRLGAPQNQRFAKADDALPRLPVTTRRKAGQKLRPIQSPIRPKGNWGL